MGKSHEDSQREVRELFSKLSSWMEESHRQFSTLITSNNEIITKGVDDLVEEVMTLQVELSTIKKEKNILIETVNCLNGEIKRCNERISEKNQDAEEIEEQKPQAKQEDCVYPVEIEHHTGKELLREEDIRDEEIVEPIANDNDKTHKNYQNNFNGSSNNESQLIKEETIDFTESSKLSEESVCPECDFVFSTRKNLEIHRQNVHPKLEPSNVTDKEISNIKDQDIISRNEADNESIADKKYKCPKWPLDFHHNNLARHITAAHNKIRNNICQECGKAFSSKDSLSEHKASVHNLGGKCEKCPFKTDNKTKMKIHRASVHKIDLGMKKLKCGKCSYETFRSGHLNDHIRSVHEKIRTHLCEKCDYSTGHKQSLKIHRASAHNMDVGMKKWKCEKCPYETFKVGCLYRHIRSVHDKIRSHICEECDYATSQMVNLKRHKRSVHKMIAPEINPT